jgi:uncharacterized membrane-anchored protein
MGALVLDDHPSRYELINELHARPFPELAAPCRAAFLAIKPARGAAERDRSRDLAHLVALLDRFGAPHPPPGANHWSGRIGRHLLKWEMHTEFVTYTLIGDDEGLQHFSGEMFALFPADWLREAPGVVVASALMRVDAVPAEEIAQRLAEDAPRWFVLESLAVSRVLDGEATVAGDFRLDENGHFRFAVFAAPGIGPRRLGRIVMRLLEIATYAAMALLTLPHARSVAARVAGLDRELTALVATMASEQGGEAATLDRLLRMEAEIAYLASSTAFRFGAAEAYAALVGQRIEALRETRIGGRQLMGEFMARRFDPAMRTCRSAKSRLDELSARAERAANLLRTRVDVASQQASQETLRAMDRRAALQLRLQETVEGLSVVAISYYAVGLVAGLLAPLAAPAGLDRAMLSAAVTPVVVLAVFLFIRRIRRRIARDEERGR